MIRFGNIYSEEGTKDIENFQLPFQQKTIYYFWHQEVQNKWCFSGIFAQERC